MPKKHKKRQPKVEFEPSEEKTPKIPVLDKDSETILFCFNKFDNTVRIADHKHNKDDFWDISSKLKSFESMTWAHLAANEDKHHTVDKNKICKEGQDSLFKLKIDDTDNIWSLSLNGRKRLWGIRYTRYFVVIWWDPQHKICVSKKRNT